MFENLQLAAIAIEGGAWCLRRVPLHQSLQVTLGGEWFEQYQGFVEGVDEIEFNAGYQPEAHERFRLMEFDLPEWLDGEDSLSAGDLEPLPQDAGAMERIKGIVGFARDAAGQELLLFQNFTRSHVIRPGRFLFLRNDTYETTESAGLTLAKKLSGVYAPVDGKLLFQSFRTVNTFLPIADFYEEASEQEIRDVLEHELLSPEDADLVVREANQWSRKRFALLRDSGVLDQYGADEIKERSVGFDVEIEVTDGRIVFPADKRSAKKLLQFLNEELFRGAITETLYETNSKREAD